MGGFYEFKNQCYLPDEDDWLMDGKGIRQRKSQTFESWCKSYGKSKSFKKGKDLICIVPLGNFTGCEQLPELVREYVSIFLQADCKVLKPIGEKGLNPRRNEDSPTIKQLDVVPCAKAVKTAASGEKRRK